ncbi:MAG: biotin transporter BioY [Lachnospiraceae bacterium]|nr:biotin transporter BioY [Lachnospiraceae bacterium]
MDMRDNKIQNLTLTALMAAILCIMGPIVIPIGMVPLSFANMAIYLAIILLDKKKALISTTIYLLMGLVGIPVYSGFSAGAGKLLGPTGGYLIGYLALSFLGGSLLEKRKCREKGKLFNQIMALSVGTLGLYLVGTVWLMYQSKLNLTTALSVGVFPFVFFDIVKIILAISIGNSIKKRIKFLL